MQYAVRWVWEISLSVWLFTLVIVVALRMRNIGEADNGNEANPAAGETRTLPRWLFFGFLWGLLALSNPSLQLFFLPAASGFCWGQNLRRQLGYAATSALIYLICVTPWVMRNWTAFHCFVPMRANFGAELYLGNGPGANGFLMEYDNPMQSLQQWRLYDQMGEVAYAKMRGRLAWQNIEADPQLFVRNSIKRVYFIG